MLVVQVEAWGGRYMLTVWLSPTEEQLEYSLVSSISYHQFEFVFSQNERETHSEINE